MALWTRRALWGGAWLLGAVVAVAALGQWRLAELRAAFELDARIAHRLLSQRMAQHDAVLATLTLYPTPVAPSDTAAAAVAAADAQLQRLYPQVLKVWRQAPAVAPDWVDAEARARATGQAQLWGLDWAQGRYGLLRTGPAGVVALQIDLHQSVPWAEWPLAGADNPVAVSVWRQGQPGQGWVLQPGALAPAGAGGWTFVLRKPLASESQRFELQLQRHVGWAELPWTAMVAAAGLWGVGLLVWRAVLRQREQRARAEELLRLGQVSRLNALGELAAGLAHELNQPLTAIVANTQAAKRLLDEDEPSELPLARQAMAQAVAQAHRAAEVVARLRRTVAQPDSTVTTPLVLADAVRSALHLLAPECERAQVQLSVALAPLQVLAEPVALEQVIHNLLMNALQALAQVPPDQRQLSLSVQAQDGWVCLSVTDSGPGFSEETRRRLFEPFFTTRPDGLGLGLSLCETLLGRLGGRLEAAHHTPRGAVLRVWLPEASAASAVISSQTVLP